MRQGFLHANGLQRQGIWWLPCFPRSSAVASRVRIRGLHCSPQVHGEEQSFLIALT